MLRGLIFGVVLAGVGWIAGSIYPAPASITGPVARNAPNVAARLGIDEVSIESLRRILSDEDLARIRREASELAARTGEAIVIQRDAETAQSVAEQIAALQIAPVAAPAAATAPATTGAGNARAFEAALSLCPGMTVSNAPAADARRQVRSFSPLVNVNGTAIAVNPTTGACLSSAFGPRGSGQHKGVDYHAATGGPILAAANGVVVEAVYRDDFGNMLLIDHGNGVYTRYAHLSSFAEGVVQGANVAAGQQIGLMGNTASYAIPIHLHYEVLTGDYNNPRRSFGLTPNSPFAFPGAD